MSAKDVQYTDPSRQSGPPPDSDLDNYDRESASRFVSGLDVIKERRRKSKRNKIILISVISMLLLAGLGAGGFFLLNKEKPAPQQQAQESAQNEPEPAEETAPVEEYNSKDLQLSLEYPGDWTVDDSEQGRLTITSPEVMLKDASGTDTQGKVVFTIVSAGSDITGFAGNSGMAAAESEKITYTRPSQNQRKQTYLTQVSFGGNGIEAIYVTGDNGYQKDQNVPKGDVAKIEPIISVTFEGSEGELMSVSDEEWGENSALIAVADIVKSLRID